jgi:hypothetical protein
MGKRTTHTPGPGLPLVTLTTTQHSAYGDLLRFGRLYPPGPRQLVQRGTSQGFSKRTLQALVDKGFAEWAPRVDGTWVSIIPKAKP